MDFLKHIINLIEDGEDLIKNKYTNQFSIYYYVDSEKFRSWKTRSMNFIKNIDNDVYFEEFKSEVEDNYASDAESGLGILKAIEIEFNNDTLFSKGKKYLNSSESSLDKVKNLCEKFHLIVRYLKNRKKGKRKNKLYNPLLIEEEMDAQYLFKALLSLNFNNIQDEESTPSTGGINSRIDFLLPEDKIGIEIKMTSSTLKNDKLTEQLNDDIIKYKKHPKCKTLIFFIYNPGNHIINSNGFEKDYTKNIDGLNIITFIRP